MGYADGLNIKVEDTYRNPISAAQGRLRILNAAD
jgi:hypothetical protein